MPASRHAVLDPPTAARPRPTARRRGRRMTPLARDLVVVLAIKAAALVLLWFAFFRAPAAPDMVVDPGQVADRVLASKAAHAEP